MKRTIFSLALCALCAEATAQTVTVADVEALPGETAVFTLNLKDGKAGTYTAMQFDAQFPATGFSITGDYNVTPLWKNATAVIGDVDASGTATIPVASSEAINAADVDGLLTVSFTVGSDVTVGDYDVTLKNLWFGYGTSSKDYLDDITFTVHVVNIHSVVLDENSTTAPTATDGAVNVRVIRTINANEWGTICLPFAMTEAQVKEAFGSDVELAKFSSWSAEEDDGGAIVGINVGFETVTAIEANVPLIIKTSTPVTEFQVEGVDIEPDEAKVQVGKKSSERGYMYGNYVNGFNVPEENVFLSGGKFYYSVGNTPMMGYRAYFEFKEVLDAYYDVAPSRFNIVIDGAATGMQLQRLATGDNRYYNLSGQSVEHPAKGVYINNGKKCIVK